MGLRWLGPCRPREKVALDLHGASFVLAILLVLVGLSSHLVLPSKIESRFATNLREEYGLLLEPEVEDFSDFPPELLLGRVDRIGGQIDQLMREGKPLRDLRKEFRNADFSMWSLLRGYLEREIQAGSLVAFASLSFIAVFAIVNFIWAKETEKPTLKVAPYVGSDGLSLASVTVVVLLSHHRFSALLIAAGIAATSALGAVVVRAACRPEG